MINPPQTFPNGQMTPQILINLIRMFLRDKPKLNALIKKEETDDDEIKLAINMAISDWNSTPPLLTHVGLTNFPVMDWLIVASAMFILQSAGVLQYRNELQFNDSGITTSPWTKGPAYMGVAGMWAQLVEKKKYEFKLAINYGRTFGIVKSAEYMLWDYSGLYTGPDYLTATGTSSMSAVPGGILGPNGPSGRPQTPQKTDPFVFVMSNWTLDPINNRYVINFYHNLNSDVDVRIMDPITGTDLRNKVNIVFQNKNVLFIWVPIVPDTRMEGQMIAFKL